MHDVNFLSTNLEAVRAKLEQRNFPLAALDSFVALDERRRTLIRESEDLKAARNRESQEIGKLMKAGQYEAATGRQWTQPIGFVHALFEVAASVLKQVGDVADKQALADAIKATRMSTIVGKVDWTRAQADFPNVSRTPLVGGQWRKGTTWPFELEIVSNTVHPEIPATSTLQPIT